MLGVLGLSAADQELYESVVAAGQPVTPADLAGDRARVVAGLARLERLGLVVALPGGPAHRWTAVAPDGALEALIAAQRRALRQTRSRQARLAARYRGAADTDPADLVEVIHGREAAQRASDRLQRRARREIRVFDAPPYVTQPTDRNPTEHDTLRRGIRHRVLYDRRGVAVPGRLEHLAASVAAGEEARITDVPMKLVLSDEPLALVPLRLNPTDLESWLVVHDPVLLEALSALFEMYWERAVPLRVGPGPGGTVQQVAHDEPTPTERDLLSLLVAGLTDEAIADNLGLHPRTVRRRLRALMTRLDAATRFQAGYQAVQRGWLAHDDHAEAP
ncbi:MAG: LuxR C-terminal-related transcriptional regulator [Mycobacteriales bacterium]